MLFIFHQLLVFFILTKLQHMLKTISASETEWIDGWMDGLNGESKSLREMYKPSTIS